MKAVARTRGQIPPPRPSSPSIEEGLPHTANSPHRASARNNFAFSSPLSPALSSVPSPQPSPSLSEVPPAQDRRPIARSSLADLPRLQSSSATAPRFRVPRPCGLGGCIGGTIATALLVPGVTLMGVGLSQSVEFKVSDCEKTQDCESETLVMIGGALVALSALTTLGMCWVGRSNMD